MSEYKIYTKQDIDDKKAPLQPGNFLVTHGHDFLDKITQIFTLSTWNHAALIVDTKGTIIELTTTGIKKKHISEYHKEDIYVVEVTMSHEDRRQVHEYANVMLKKHATYGFLTIVTIALKIITRSRLIIKLDGTLICSEFVARALAQGGIIWDKDPALITPADLYNRFIKKTL